MHVFIKIHLYLFIDIINQSYICNRCNRVPHTHATIHNNILKGESENCLRGRPMV